MNGRRPRAEVAIDDALVRRLLAAQHPALADRPLVQVAEGWDNVIFRLGTEWAVRLPRREAAVGAIVVEQRWLPGLAADLGIAVPVPAFRGRPGPGYPWPWSVTPWIPGHTADVEPLRPGQGRVLAAVLRRLHVPAPAEAPSNPLRGVPLRDRAPSVEERLARLGAMGGDEKARLHGLWTAGLDAEAAADRTWLHGDLHPRNVVVRDGVLAGLLDWGDLTAGDPATDVAAAWTVLRSEAERRAFRAEYDAAGPLWHRARAWAVFFAVALGTSGEPDHEAMGRAILDALAP